MTDHPPFDPISLEIMWSRLIGIADDMWTTVLRTAVSTIIGAVIIIGAGFYIFLREQKLGREDAVVNPPA